VGFRAFLRLIDIQINNVQHHIFLRGIELLSVYGHLDSREPIVKPTCKKGRFFCFIKKQLKLRIYDTIYAKTRQKQVFLARQNRKIFDHYSSMPIRLKFSRWRRNVKGLSSSPGTNGRKRICRLPVSILLIALCFILLTSASYPAFASQAVSPAPLKSNTQAPTTLLQENFDDGVAQGFGNEAGGWKVIDGKYTATTGQFRFSTAGDLSWQDYVIEADYTNAQDGGLLVRVQDFNNCISLVIRPNYNDVSWNIRKNGAWGPGLGTVPLGYKAGSNMHVKIEVSGSDFQAYINGELKTTLKTADFPKGKIGVYLFSPGNQYWDNVVVYSGSTSSNPAPVARGLLYQATLKSGDYGGGSAVSPSTGIVDSSEGVKFVSTESDKQSNALINWVVPADRRAQFRSQGTISFLFKADRQNHVDGAILGDNGGFNSFNNGQSTFSAVTYRLPNGSGVEDDQFHIKWSTWHNADWKYHPLAGQPNLVLEYDRWYNLGFTWGGPSNNFEIWVSGTLKAQDSQAGAALPWGDASMGTGSGTNIGLGDNHERGVDQNNSIAGVTFADICIWDEYRANGDTHPSAEDTIPTPTPTLTQTPVPPVTAAGLVAFYPFDSDYQDHSGVGNHGTPKGSIPFVPAAVGNGAKFDGKSWLEVNDSVSLDLYNAYTFSAWIYKENAGAGGWSVILEKADSSAMDNRSPYGFAHTQDGYSPIVHFAYDNKLSTISSDTRTNFKEWNLTTVTWDGANVRFYINGVLKATKAWNNTLPNSASKLSIGCGPVGSTEYFVGIIDELRIYNRAISQEEVKSLYGAGTPGSSVPVSPPSTSTPIPQPPISPPKSPQQVTPSQTPASPLPSGLTFESRSKASGSTVQIPLTLKGTTEKIGNIDLTLNYDPTVLKAGEALKGSLTTGSIFDFNVTSPGTIKISLADKAGFEGDGSVAYVTFSVIGAAGATSPLKIASASANRASDMASVKLATHDGTFKVLGSDQLKGDFDGDGKLTALDALAALQMAVGKRAEDLVMDVTADGKVTSADARKILQMAVSAADNIKPAVGTTEPDIPLVKMQMTGGNPTFDLPADTISKVAMPNQAVVIESGAVKLTVPAGGVTKNTEVVIKKFTQAPPVIPSTARNASAPKARALGYVYDVGPNGLKFEKPVQLTMSYDESALAPGEDERNIVLAYYDGTDWVGIGGLVDTEKNTISIMVTEFPGEPVIPAVITIGYTIKLGVAFLIMIAGGFAAYVAFTEPYQSGYAHEYVTPFNDTVQKFSGQIRVNGKPFYSPEDLAPIVEAYGTKTIQFDVNGELIEAVYKDPGNVWFMPEVWFSNGMTNGDCNEFANGYCSILRAKGFKAKCVYGSTKTGRETGGQTHVWVEVEVNGKVYYLDNDNKIDLLSSLQTIHELQKVIMWDEMGQQPYKDKWWEEPPVVPPPPAPGSTGRMVTAVGVFTGLEKLGYKAGYWSQNFIELRFNSAGGETIVGTGLLYHSETNLNKEVYTDSVSFNFTMGKYWRSNGTAYEAFVIIRKYHKDSQIDGWADAKTVRYTFIKSGFEEVVSGDIIEGKLDNDEWPGPFRLVVK
jgi:hypothetical protein